MWIKFTSKEMFAIKIHVGGINAVSGEPSYKTEQTQARRYKLLSEKKSIQGYVVVPKQLWLDGIASTDGTVRQFVAVPIGSGYTVEAQITGTDLVGGLQLEVVPVKVEQPTETKSRGPVYSWPGFAGTGNMKMFVEVHLRAHKMLVLHVDPCDTIDRLWSLIQAAGGYSPTCLRLMFRCAPLYQRDRTLSDYNIQEGSKLWLREEQRGGGGGWEPESEMGIGAGGLIKQTIVKDRYEPHVWDPDGSTIFNVQIRNSAAFKSVTGEDPPETPITAETYAEHGFPY